MIEQKNKIKLFEDKRIRYKWDEETQKWWFSVVDVVTVLTDSVDHLTARKYWNKLKQRLKEEGSELVTNCHQLKMQAADGEFYKTDVADAEQLLRIIQPVPSKKAEPFKLWLAKVGSERLDETVDPEISIDRAIHNYRRLGYSEKWINQRIKSIEVRKALTDISVEREPIGFQESAQVAKEGAEVAKGARKQLEQRTGKSAVSPLNARNLGQRAIENSNTFPKNSNLPELPTSSSVDDLRGEGDD